MNVIQIGLLFLFQALLFYLCGVLVMRICYPSCQSFTLTAITGFFCWFGIWGLIAVPLIILIQPLHVLTGVAAVWGAGVMISACVFGRSVIVRQIRGIGGSLREHSYMLIPLFFAVLIQMVFVFTHMDQSADACYYIGKITTNVYTDTMGVYGPYTGLMRTELEGRRVMACFEEYSAVIAQLFRIHPLKQAKLIMPELLIVLANMIFYQIGRALLHGRKKSADGLVFFVFLLNMYSYTVYTASTFLLTRTYEGKSILGNLVIPGLFLGFLALWKGEENRFWRVLLFFVSLSSSFLSSSAMLVVPAGLTAGLLVWIFREKRWKSIFFYLLCMLPNLAVCAVYYLTSKGILVFRV